MRIIAGEFRGRTIKFPKSKLVRPTTDKNKETIFNMLNNLINFEAIKTCDIYAGSGSLGLEALSRGAEEVHFVEKNFHVQKMLRENIRNLNSENNCRVLNMTALKFSSLSEHDTYDLILLDPPFFKDDIHQVVENLFKNNFLNKNGIMLVERSIQTKEKDVENFGKDPLKRLGDSLIYIFD
ncbi:16S rRNA (guanine(966)-N(2))-methyltransferase [hydrothermal vent metagenome]|uniref:16S rRNA (Guanine(966)-N(2))-methyltransferase n=1 Tax=hydrothermal vent metagenome TaxID=652676 RepID=A0A3B1C3S2_9ZZZZ